MTAGENSAAIGENSAAIGENSAAIKAKAVALGFDACAIADAVVSANDAAGLDAWLESGFSADMDWMKKTAAVICPGRGTYTKAELGYLKKHGPTVSGLVDRIDSRAMFF